MTGYVLCILELYGKQAYMENSEFNVDLIRQAQLGNEESLGKLAKLSRERLHDHIYRITLREEVTQDIVQESILEMLKFLDKLERKDRFWPWLRRIATNKLHRYHQQEQRQRRIHTFPKGHTGSGNERHEGMANLIGKELKQIVFAAMHQLKSRHREILVLRCYEEMSYFQIAQEMDCTEFGARRLFFRAKKALTKQLSRNGVGKGSLLTALVVFGQMTASSEASAAQVSISAATVKVGAGATLACIAGSKTALVSLATAGALALGTTAVISESDMAAKYETNQVRSMQVAPHTTQANTGNEEYWYYYPSNTSGILLMKIMTTDSKGKYSYCRYFQDERANYYFDKRRNTIYTNNFRTWHGDLTVWRLPTDKPNLKEFFSRIDGKVDPVEYVRRDRKALLVSVTNDSQKIQHHDVLDEEFFRYNWPVGTKIVDNRDAMHKRGWTYFRIDGEVRGDRITGVGRLPFVCAAFRDNWPWLRLRVGEKEFVDAGQGVLFKGLARPWMGLHSIDTVRRDAAQQEVTFETRSRPNSGKMEVELTGKGKIGLVYTIDMEKDLIEKITFSNYAGNVGELRFTYLGEIDNLGWEFEEPRRTRAGIPRVSPGMLWLVDLATDSL